MSIQSWSFIITLGDRQLCRGTNGNQDVLGVEDQIHLPFNCLQDENIRDNLYREDFSGTCNRQLIYDVVDFDIP